MHVDVVNSIVIARHIAEVSQYAADPDNAPQWYGKHQVCRVENAASGAPDNPREPCR
jgi:hypothetical protein